MYINEVAKKSGLSCKAIRFYEQKKVITPPLRHANGYRDYTQNHLQELTLLRNARRAGFRLDECRELLRLLNDPARHSAEVKAKTLQKVQEIELHIHELSAIRQQLLALTERCPGDQQACCPIIDNFITHC